jgi:hypothetical protein
MVRATYAEYDDKDAPLRTDDGGSDRMCRDVRA